MNNAQIKAAQDLGKTLLVCDVDRSLDVVAMAADGVNVGRLLVTQPDNGAQLHDVVISVLKAGVVDVVLFVGRVSDYTRVQIRMHAAGSPAELVFA